MSFNETISVMEDKKSPRRKLFQDSTILSSSHAHSEPGTSHVHQNLPQYRGFTPGHRSSSMNASLIQNFNQSFPPMARVRPRKSSSIKSRDFQTPVKLGPTQFSKGRSPSASSERYQNSPMANSTFTSTSPANFTLRSTPGHVTPRRSSSIKSEHFQSPADSSIHSDIFDESDADSTDFIMSPKKQEQSLLEWFDKSMENEIEKHGTIKNPHLILPNRSGLSHSLMVDATAGAAEIEAGLRGDFDTELQDAADKFVKAEAIVAFEGAVRAAEEAAARAPREFAEDAAVAGARGFQAELTSCVNEKIHGSRPLEVLGYIGITRPKTIIKSSS